MTAVSGAVQSIASVQGIARMTTGDIVALRMAHCRAEQAAKAAQYHLAAQHYHACLEAAEYRQDARATQFFALKLADCYEAMGLLPKAIAFRALAGAEEDAGLVSLIHE